MSKEENKSPLNTQQVKRQTQRDELRAEFEIMYENYIREKEKKEKKKTPLK